MKPIVLCQRVSRVSARAGFSLVEIMFAIGILMVGMLSVGALLPVGGKLQRLSYDDTMGALLASNAEAIIRAKGIAASEMAAEASSPQVTPMTSYNDATYNVVGNDYLPADRTLATFNAMFVTGSPPQLASNIDSRLFEFIFAGRTDITTNRREVFVFICRRVNGGLLTPVSVTAQRVTTRQFRMPKPIDASAPSKTFTDYFNPNGEMLDLNGNLYRVVTVNETASGYVVDVDQAIPGPNVSLYYVKNSGTIAGAPLAPARVLRILKFGPEVIR
jgi:hypothetical protein